MVESSIAGRAAQGYGVAIAGRAPVVGSIDYNTRMWHHARRALREPVNGVTHLTAAAAAAVGTGYLLLSGEAGARPSLALLIYGATLVLMFLISGIYHSTKGPARRIALLRRLDHAAIFLLIAGTYTPITSEFIDDPLRTGLLAAIWGMAAAGATIKLSGVRLPRWASAGIYLAMGWLALIGWDTWLTAIPAPGLLWLGLGGLFFTVGAIVYVTEWPDLFPGRFGFHEIWHLFVIGGAGSHFMLVAGYVAR